MIAKIYDALFKTVPEKHKQECTGCVFDLENGECAHPEIKINGVGCLKGHFIFKPHDDAARAWVVAKVLTK